MLVEKEIRSNKTGNNDKHISEPSTAHTSSAPLPLHCNQQHARNERLLNMRKIKSRNAARTRRSKENFEFYELAKLLPIPVDTSSQLDKASIIRLTMSFLKVREFSFCNVSSWIISNEGPPPNRNVKDASRSVKCALQEEAISKLFEKELGSRILQSLDGFMFALNCQGKFLYISETVSIYLGLSQVEIIGTSIFDYTYPDDRNELALHLGLTLTSPLDESVDKTEKNAGEDYRQGSRSFFIRMKSTLTKRGVSPKSSSYKVVHISTHAQRSVRKRYLSSKRKLDQSTTLKNQKNSPLGIIAFGSTLSLQSQSDLPVDKDVFVVRVNPALQFTYCDTNITELMGYDVREVVGQNFYHNLHAKDTEKIKKCHLELLTKGNVRTPYYRWLHKSGGYRWVYSSISLMANQRLYPDQTFIWINHVISDLCEEDKVLDMFQLPLEEQDRHRKLLKRHHIESGNHAGKQKILCVGKDLAKKNSQQDLEKDSNVFCAKSINHAKDILPEKREQDPIINSKMIIDSLEPIDKNNNTVMCESACIIKDQPKMNKVSNQAEDIAKCESKTGAIDLSKRDKFETKSRTVPAATSKCCFVDNKIHNETKNQKERSCIPKEITLKYGNSEEYDRVEVSPTKSSDSFCKNTDEDGTVKIFCMASRFPEIETASELPKKQTTIYTDSVSEYMDADSTVWANPPNKEIFNHDDLPPGIKQMNGLWSIRHTPSAVHHHYPFGINPTLLHSNPLLAKIMMAGWGHQLPHANPFMLTTPVHLMSPVCTQEDCGQITQRIITAASPDSNTPASVAAVLEELKKDPLHKVNPPNKVICPNANTENAFKTLSDPRYKFEVPRTSTMKTHHKSKFENTANSGTEIPSRMLTTLNLYAGEVLNPHVSRAQTVIQMPSSILLPANSMLLNGSDTSLIALNSDSTLKLPLSTTHFQQHVNPCVIQPFTFPQVAKVRSVPF